MTDRIIIADSTIQERGIKVRTGVKITLDEPISAMLSPIMQAFLQMTTINELVAALKQQNHKIKVLPNLDLSGVDFTGCFLKGIDFSGSDIRASKGDFTGSFYDDQTLMSEDQKKIMALQLQVESRWSCCFWVFKCLKYC